MMGEDPRSLLRQVVQRVESAHPELAGEMRELLTSNIESLDGDPQLTELLQASIESNLSTIFHMLINDIDLHALKPPTAAVEYAVRLAQRDIQLSALTRAYYLAQSLLLRITLDEVERLDLPDGSRLELVRAVANAIHSYIDWMLQRVTDEYGTEHRRWWSARATTNTALIMKVLRGEQVSPQTFSAETHYELEQRHLAMVAWFEDPSGGVEAQQRLDRLVRQVAALLGSPHAPLISAVDRTTAWSWVSMPVPSLPETVRRALDEVVAAAPGVRLAIGGIAGGAGGFRSSHEQAVGAWQVALAAARFRAAPVVADADAHVALTSILLKDRYASLSWMRRVLGTFAGGGEANAAVRETLRVFFESGQNYSRTAELTGVHRNTVRHRVARFEAQRGGAQAVDPLEVALALRIHDTFDASEARV
jgi:DNA-binding PucR family transcriptional regulator